jgi:hypothetical protein
MQSKENNMKRLIKKWRDWREDRLLAEYRARDADVGVPTMDTLEKRCAEAAWKSQWKIIFDCLDKGVDVNRFTLGLKVKRKDYNLLTGIQKIPLTYIAAYDNNAQILQELINRGADVNARCSGVSDGPYYDHRAIDIAEEKDYREVIKVIKAEEARQKQQAAVHVARAQTPSTSQKPKNSDEATLAIDLVSVLPESLRYETLKEMSEKFASDFEKIANEKQDAATSKILPAPGAAVRTVPIRLKPRAGAREQAKPEQPTATGPKGTGKWRKLFRGAGASSPQSG